MLEILFEFLWELLIQMVLEILVELGFHAVAEPFRREPAPWLAALGYLLLGAILGGLSLFAFPSHMVTARAFRALNLLLAPIAAGALMSALGIWRASRGQAILRIDRFLYGFLFALGLAAVRFWLAK